MRRFIWLSAVLVAFGAAGLAVADTHSSKAIKAVSATFNATTVSNSQTRTCTNQDGTFSFTKADYAGTATSSDPSLNGPIALHVRSSINTTKNLGVVEGKLRIGGSADAHFSAVYANGQLGGLASGHAQEPYARLLANLSASFSATGGFTNGRLGNTAGGGAVELQPGGCEPSQAQAENQQRSETRGTVSALSSSSITVGTVTCTIPASLAAQVASHVKVGDRVVLRCMVVNGQSTLVKVKSAHDEH